MPSQLDGAALRKALLSASNNLSNQKKSVDDLNVFPVPDGDTGTNMSMTISAAARDLLPMDEDGPVSQISDRIASASLRGARGNSGVILSQLFRGLAKGLAGKDTVDTLGLAAAFKSASDTAYKAVMKPTEGTILTVAREAAQYAVEIAGETEDIADFLESVIQRAKESLAKTPELLPVLKQAGVVDAGGAGLVIILEGALSSLRGTDIEAAQPREAARTARLEPIDTENILFMYCTEFIITKKSLNYSVQSFRAAIERWGDSMLVIEDADIVKVHIHTNRPGKVLEEAVKIGDLNDIKIDNMKHQHNEIIGHSHDPAPAEPPKKYGLVAVAAGSGIKQIFKDIGVGVVVSGGQSMNPSTDDILTAVTEVNAENILVFPNNKNIILAAEQAAKLSEKNVIVIPSKTIPQGISAILSFDADAEPEANREQMSEALSYIKTGLVTFAARSSDIDDLHINEGDIMGLEEGQITHLGSSPHEVALDVIKGLADEEAGVISLFYGEDVSEEDAEALANLIRAAYPKCDVISHSGGQPLYYYIISVE